MDSSESSSEDECNMYVNAASTLSALNQQKLKHGDDENDDKVVVDEPKISPKLNGRVGVEMLNEITIDSCSVDESSNDSCLTNESETLNQFNHKNKENDLVISIEDDDNNIPTRRFTRSYAKKANRICTNTESVIILDDTIEGELNNTFNLQENEENDNCITIGTPVRETRRNSDDYEVSVKILWKSNKMNRFEMGKYETFQKVFKYFSDLEGVPEDQILITKNDKRINPFDSPAAIDWSVIDILDGGVVSAEIAKKSKESSASDSLQENVCKIKVQISDKKSLQVTLKPEEKFACIVRSCAEQLNIPESKLKFYFDGELINIDETPESLDLDDTACVDLKILD